MNEPTKGKLAAGEPGHDARRPLDAHPDRRRAEHPPAALGGRATATGRLDLVVAPIFGPTARPPAFDQEPAAIVLSSTRDPTRSRAAGVDGSRVGDAPVLHAIEVIDLDGDGRRRHPRREQPRCDPVRGVAMHAAAPVIRPRALAPGPRRRPRRRGRARSTRPPHGRPTVPRHGRALARHRGRRLPRPSRRSRSTFGPRTVIDTTLKEGHALWVADVDGDGDDEVFAGYRGPGTSVLITTSTASLGPHRARRRDRRAGPPRRRPRRRRHARRRRHRRQDAQRRLVPAEEAGR